MCRVQIESPIRVLNAEMFATPSATFELPQYASELAHFLDIEAEQGEESDRHSNHSG
jgi:hypothetical protein